MKDYYSDILYLSSCFIHENRAHLRPDMDFERIYNEALAQSADLWVISAVCGADNASVCPVLSRFNSLLVSEAAKNALKRAHVKKLIADLSAAGLSPIVIKGETVSRLYPNPLLRRSVDTDLFFQTLTECEKARDLLISRGGVLLHPNAVDKHFCMSVPGAGRVELHHLLLTEDFRSSILRGFQTAPQPLENVSAKDGFSMTTLGKTDNLIFLTAHFLQHFLFSRCDIRQIADILMYITSFKDEIDADLFFRFLDHTNRRTFFGVVQGAGIEGLGFDKEELFDIPYNTENVSLFLQDCFAGCAKGIWSKSDGPARGLGVAGNKIRYGHNHSAYIRATLKGVSRALFPPKAFLAELFPYYKRHPLLLPAAWFNNIAALVSGTASAQRLSRRRSRLLQRLEFTD